MQQAARMRRWHAAGDDLCAAVIGEIGCGRPQEELKAWRITWLGDLPEAAVMTLKKMQAPRDAPAKIAIM
jgi:hypothetical protein